MMNQILTYLMCLVLPLGFVVVLAVAGTNSRLKEAGRIRDALAVGAYDNLSRQPLKNLLRVLLVVELVLLTSGLAVLLLAVTRPEWVFNIAGFATMAVVLLAMLFIGLYISRLVSRPAK